MNSPSIIITRVHFSIGLLIFLNLFFCQFPQPVQTIALSQLCGRFGHSCYGGNWGKRTLPDDLSQQYILWDPNINNDKTAVLPVIDPNDILEELQSELFRQRLRQLMDLK
ncbi:unnamed protein product [Rotaria sp. Silwood1]|nr:unnamed protein product [Rotaria sp. Silwood1]CAF1154064.1 unnamed protein product [Rotaria sp. Silwood1]CAF3463030.1 unnamed protein product [Rotaria sp. Silwood1]CAF3562102.1 unnamed protein product [Rotaria sp. Silwood1]CAF4656960.1 unnamed protein product [Rotaria sp. Silwood1]